MNPATRIYSIVQTFSATNTNATIQSIWEKYLAEQSAPPISEDDVIIAAQALMAEVRSMENKLKSLEVPQDLYADCVNRLRTAFSPTQLAVPWQGHKEIIEKQATQLALRWTHWALSKFDETDIDESSLQDLVTSLAAQEVLLKTTALPLGLREILERQTRALRRAIQLYRITGAEPVRKVVTDAFGEFGTASTTLAAEVEQSSSSVKDVLAKGMQLIGKTAEIADKGSKIVKFGKDIYQLGSTGYQLGTSLLQSLPSV
jgi:hypothetical protein